MHSELIHSVQYCHQTILMHETWTAYEFFSLLFQQLMSYKRPINMSCSTKTVSDGIVPIPTRFCLFVTRFLTGDYASYLPGRNALKKLRKLINAGNDKLFHDITLDCFTVAGEGCCSSVEARIFGVASLPLCHCACTVATARTRKGWWRWAAKSKVKS